MEQCAVIENGYWDIQDLSRYLKVKIKTLYAMMLGAFPIIAWGSSFDSGNRKLTPGWKTTEARLSVRSNKSESIKGRRSGKGNADIDRLIRKAIDQSKQKPIILTTGNQTGSRDPERR